MSEHNPQAKEAAVSNKNQFWNRIQLIMILLVFAAPIIAAFLYKPTKFNNFGDLYTPARPVENLVLEGQQGPIDFDSFRHY